MPEREFVMTKACLLSDRSVVTILGADAAAFLQRLVTNSVLDVAPGESRFAALLSAQGKLMFDFFLVPAPEGTEAGFYLECPLALKDGLIDNLAFHKLRAKVAIADQSSHCAVAAVWEGEPAPLPGVIIYRDMRAPRMGLRAIAPRELAQDFSISSEAEYESHRIAEGVPKGGLDFAYGEAFVQDANLDWLNGVDFRKGCFVGQEVASRVHHRKSARKRIVKIHFTGPAPETGAPITAGPTTIGQIGSISGADGLAMLRLDRLEEARKTGDALMAGETAIEPQM